MRLEALRWTALITLFAGSPALAQRNAKPVERPAGSKTNGIGMKLVLIPAGEFLMGSPDTDGDAGPEEKPQHRVRISRAFYLGETEVTQGQYRAVTGANPSFAQGADDVPVDHVSWIDALAFCNSLSEREGLKPYYRPGTGERLGGDGYRLPTEAEWEYACRAGSSKRYSWGDYAWNDGNENLKVYAWFDPLGSQARPVAQKKPTAWGLYDMHCNVWEWCWDGYDKDYYRQSPAVDPQGPPQAIGRVTRGGGCGPNRDPLVVRSAYRSVADPSTRYKTVGLRVARTHPGP